MAEFTSVHRCNRNDGDFCKTYSFTQCNTEIEAYENMLDQFIKDYLLINQMDVLELDSNKKLVVEYMMSNKTVLFEWEYERKNNFDTYFVMYGNSFNQSNMNKSEEMENILIKLSLIPPRENIAVSY